MRKLFSTYFQSLMLTVNMTTTVSSENNTDSDDVALAGKDNRLGLMCNMRQSVQGVSKHV